MYALESNGNIFLLYYLKDRGNIFLLYYLKDRISLCRASSYIHKPVGDFAGKDQGRIPSHR